MNLIKLMCVSILSISFAQAATVNSVEVVGENLEISVSYGGGCEEHAFELKIGGCLESYPVQCSAKLIHTMPNGYDMCEAYITETVVMSLESLGLDDGYYNGASLTIKGAGQSSATTRLPFVQ